MKIFRWLLSHFFLILLIVVVIYGYMFWGNLAGEKTPAGKALAYLSSEFVEVEEFINAVKAKQAQLSAEQSPVELQQASDQQSDDKPATVAVVADEEDKIAAVTKDIAQQPVSISYSHNQMRVKQNSVGQIESQPEPRAQAEVRTARVEPSTQVEPVAKTEPAPTINERAAKNGASSLRETPSQAVAARVQVTDKFISPKVEQQLNNVDKNGKVINKTLQGAAIRNSWVTARKSFYQRRYKLSEQSYQEVIKNTTDNFDAYGELGNVYFNQGKNAEAASAYFEAASILVRKGQVRRAKSLMGLLRHLDDSKAVELQKLIDAAVS